MPGQTVPLAAPEETPAPQTVHAQETVPTAPTLKSSGKVGEQLEGSPYFFKLHSFRLCGAALNDTSRAKAFGKEQGVVVAAEVEIKAKERLNISPKDVRLNRGGIVFDTSIDLKRSFKGCSPLLQLSQIGRDEVAKGFVLFDIPESESSRQDLTLHYLPTRWGGAGVVKVELGSFHEPH